MTVITTASVKITGSFSMTVARIFNWMNEAEITATTKAWSEWKFYMVEREEVMDRSMSVLWVLYEGIIGGAWVSYGRGMRGLWSECE